MKIDSRSLRLKVIVNVFSTSILLLLLFGMLIFTQINKMTSDVANENLVEQARKIASYIEYTWLGRLSIDLPRRYEEYYDDPTPAHQFGVMNAEGDLLFKSRVFMLDEARKVMGKGGKHFFSFVTKDGQNYAGLKYDYMFDGNIYPVFIIENEEEFSSFLRTLKEDFISKVFSLGLPLLCIQGLFIILIFRSALKPVLLASKDARNITYNNLSFRLNEKGLPSEILPLIQSVNEGLSRLEKSADAQKFFIANAAHELRTPISILKARIASLQNEKEIYLLNQDLRDINRLISQMLDMSRLDTDHSIPLETVNLNRIIQKACEDMGPLFIAQDKDLTLEENALDQTMDGNEDTLLRAVLNLLENALKHTPPKTPVKVILDHKKIIIRDFGTPIPDEYKIKIFERFEKLPQNIDSKGSGLGLAIVKKAAAIHGGTISINTREDGNDFVLDFS